MVFYSVNRVYMVLWQCIPPHPTNCHIRLIEQKHKIIWRAITCYINTYVCTRFSPSGNMFRAIMSEYDPNKKTAILTQLCQVFGSNNIREIFFPSDTTGSDVVHTQAFITRPYTQHHSKSCSPTDTITESLQIGTDVSKPRSTKIQTHKRFMESPVMELKQLSYSLAHLVGSLDSWVFPYHSCLAGLSARGQRCLSWCSMLVLFLCQYKYDP